MYPESALKADCFRCSSDCLALWLQVAAIHSITKMLDHISTCDCWQSLLIQLQQDLILPETPVEVGWSN